MTSQLADVASSPDVSTWHVLVIMIVTGFGAVMAHYALAVFNDSARPFMLDFVQGKTSRMETATIVFGLSAGFVFGLGAPMALSSGVLNPWLIFLPAEILGLMAPWPWLAALSGLGWGALCTLGLPFVLSFAGHLPVDFISSLQTLGTPILWIFAVFPALAAARQFGRSTGLITFGVEALTVVICMKLWPDLFAGSFAMAAGVVLLVTLAVARDRVDSRAKVARGVSRDGLITVTTGESEAGDQIFGANAARLRKHIPQFAVLGGLVAALSATHIFAGGGATSFLLAEDRIIEAAQVDFYRAFGYIPLIVTTALASGTYALAGFTFVYSAGYLIGDIVETPVAALFLAFVAGALIFMIEVSALSRLGYWLQRWPSVRDSANHISHATNESLEVAILVGSLMAAQSMGGGFGLFLVGGLYLLNEALGRPVVRLAAGPAAVIVSGVALNLLYLSGLFTPLAP